ncbi:hypothetical protein SAMN05428969_3161 [Devosia sp. YR412]|uniref:hypothetical protein n=1 Tax=Devosia sp. YR412 TaxID=1881030 RepID=UPI0008C16C36|nr:hypothetical protein [Devosia sp. YR412]SEQ47048.1 hypothetical protein SAMN05428969_3161 [Devosia sp. YR412]
MGKVEPIPVTLVTEPGRLLALDADTALLRLPANTGHGHDDGAQCPACAMRTDVRALLFDMLEGARQGLRPGFSKVVVDASAVTDTARVVDALMGKLPAQALRDHTVARSFYLAGAA